MPGTLTQPFGEVQADETSSDNQDVRHRQCLNEQIFVDHDPCDAFSLMSRRSHRSSILGSTSGAERRRRNGGEDRWK